jgi:hypothetical protein
MSTAKIDPINFAVKLVRGQFDAGVHVMVARETDPSSFPGYGDTPTLDALCRRVVGCLMAHGWTPPGGNPEPPTPEDFR